MFRSGSLAVTALTANIIIIQDMMVVYSTLERNAESVESGVAHCTSRRLIMIVTPVTQEIVWSVGVQLVVASLLWLFFPKDAEKCIPPTVISLNRLPNQVLHLSCFYREICKVS